ncbi:MAG TPA: hypothetical protein VJ911_04065 [Cryomorphaceae bacterium]|nr:hypothetical protein [Cryomorphaceae bacterium]
MMAIRVALTVGLLLLFRDLIAQDEYRPVEWHQLGQVTFEEFYSESTGQYFDRPIFSDAVKELENEKIKISGYVIPMDVEQNYYVVSKFPFASCFFCGGAGPETVIDLQLLDTDLQFKNDQRATFCGELRLNTGTFFELPFVLKNVRPCGE